MLKNRYETFFSFDSEPCKLDYYIYTENILPELAHNWHNNLEIIYIANGNAEITIGNDVFFAKRDELFVINSNILHVISPKKKVAFFCMILDPDFFKINSLDLDNINFHSYISNDIRAENLFRNVIDEYESDSPFKAAATKSAVLQFIIYLAKHYATDQDRFKISEHKYIMLAIGYIKSHINQKLFLEDVANQVGISKYCLIREFKKVTGDTPVTYINKIRCANAKKMIHRNELGLKEIGELCGFENQSYFTKVFKRYEGMTPTGYLNFLKGRAPITPILAKTKDNNIKLKSFED